MAGELKRWAALIALWMGLAGWALAAFTRHEPAEEFVGPLPGWKDVRTEYGARGDGKTDDTAAFQRALDALTFHTNFCVLYVPAGTYRITGTIKTVRRAHTDGMGMTLIGEDPERCVLLWDGPQGGVLLQWDAWYSKISRLTLDGGGRAKSALYCGPAFATYNETSDLIFRDCEEGMRIGGPQNGSAENAVWRCRFLRCSRAGVLTVNFNSMDIWVCFSRFEDCGHALYNDAGNFHAWQNLFLRSRTADIGIKNLMVFSIVNNTSFGSRRFMDFESGHVWGSPTTVSGNRILEPTENLAIVLGNAGPYLVMDNTFKIAGPSRQAIKMTWADQTLVGNAYSVTNPVIEGGRFRRLEERIVSAQSLDSQLPVLPGAPPRRVRPIIRVAAGADSASLQAALNRAAALRGQRPVVYLPMGKYVLTNTLSLPANTDLQLVGDGAAETATRLEWTGTGPALRVQGPTQAVIRDLHISGGVLFEGCDTPSGSIFASQLNVNGPASPKSGHATALLVNGLDQTDVEMLCLQGSGNGGSWVEVAGGSRAAQNLASNQIAVYLGATGSSLGQYNVRNHGRLIVRGVYHEKSADSLNGLRLSDSGVLAIDATRFSYATSPRAPLFSFENFAGLFTLTTSILLPVDSTNTCRFEMTGTGATGSILSLNNQFLVLEPGVVADKVWLNYASPLVRGGLLGCNLNILNSNLKDNLPSGYAHLDAKFAADDFARSAAGARALANLGDVTEKELHRHLEPLRRSRVWLPDGSHGSPLDLQIYRLIVNASDGAAVEFR